VVAEFIVATLKVVRNWKVRNVRSVKSMLAVGMWLALLAAYIYFHANAETFVIYLIAMTLWVVLLGYCVRSRDGRPEQESASAYYFESTPNRKPSHLVAVTAGLAVGALAAGAVFYQPLLNISLSGFAPLASPASAKSDSGFSICYRGSGQNCVVDGDTFWNEGVKIRVADVDAPETRASRCAREADIGRRATLRLRQLLNVGPFELERAGRDKDHYGRKLRVVTRYGQSLGLVLVREGLARPSMGARQTWC
jgi:endonuclease YncB( thermonuclease family)